MDISKHDEEIRGNRLAWERKPVLRKIYREFHRLVAAHLSGQSDGLTVELGSGIGAIKEVIPHCITTDLFANPLIDRVEDAYALSFAQGSLANLILFDMFHHLRYPGTAFQEFHRVLVPGGRVILLEPCMSLLGRLVYGVFHHEPLGLDEDIQLYAPAGWVREEEGYYAAQGNGSRIFRDSELPAAFAGWKVLHLQRMSAISYVLSGGYSKPQLYPDVLYPFMKYVDTMCDAVPSLFATRLFVVVEKTDG